MSNWYLKAMPTVGEVLPHLEPIANEIANIDGVLSVYAHGSIISNESKKSFPLNDVDIIADVKFNSGDLMAIDNSEAGPFAVPPDEWEDWGFNPTAVKFTRLFTRMASKKIDPWVSTSDGKVLHWGRFHENIDAWEEATKDAEKVASGVTGFNRLKISKQNEEKVAEWSRAYREACSKELSKDNIFGWEPSDHNSKEVLESAKKLK
jgi:hypothetical protein